MTTSLTPEEIVNHARYPIEDIDSAQRQVVIDHVRAELAKDGCAVLSNFLSEKGLEALLSEADERKGHTYYSPTKRCNVYLNDGNPEFPEDHPINIFIPRTNGFITADLYGDETRSHQLYYWEPLKQFLCDCLGKEKLYVYEDPVSNMIVNVGKPGQQFNWHFDTNEFTITMLLKPADSGGRFEYVPNLRSTHDECYEEVDKVLKGDRTRVKELELNAGDLQIFLGRFSLHQVTKNSGNSDRLLLIMSFSEQPGMVGSMARVKSLYGKVTDVHAQDAVRSDGLVD